MKLVTVAAIETPVEARMALNMLESAGIRAVIQDENVASMAWHWGPAVGGAKVQVADVDAVRAAALLKAAKVSERATTGTPTGVWRCSQCGEEISSGFEVCWSCGTTQDGSVDPTFAAAARDTADDAACEDDETIDQGSIHRILQPIAAIPRTFAPAQSSVMPAVKNADRQNPYASPKHANDPIVDAEEVSETTNPEQSAMVEAGWRASVVGMVLGLLSVYSLWLLLRAIMMDAEMDSATSRKFYWALFIDLCVLAAWSFLVMRIGYYQ